MGLKQTLVLCYDFLFILQVEKELQDVFNVCALYLITLTASCHRLSDSGEHARIVSDLIKRSEYLLNPFLSCFDWVNVHNTLHMPPKKNSRGVRSGDLAAYATGLPLPIFFSL